MRNTVRLFAIACFIMLGSKSFAQLSTGESPVSFTKSQLQWNVHAVTMPALDMAVINREDSMDREKGLPPRFGYPHKVNFSLENAGEWKLLPDGDRLWRLTIACPGAKSINLLYDKYWLPEGAKLFVYSKDKTQTIGAFTSRNNKGTKDNLRGFATELVFSDTVVVEYFEPKSVSRRGVVSISHVVQGYRLINMNRSGYGLGSSGSCQVNVKCSEGQNWQKEKNAVALMIVEGYRYGTGCLLNTTDNDYRPVFLTSNVCINTYDAINHNNLYSSIFYWNFEHSGCSNSATSPTYYTTSGATVLANKDFTTNCDFALLSLSEDPKSNPNIPLYYLGWDNSGNAGSSFVCIHHPKGDVKKIATRNASAYSSGNEWVLSWDQTTNGHSVPEDGSIGAPLINSSKRVVGQLFASNNLSCSNPSQDNSSFCKFSVSWTGNGSVDNRRKLQPWLDSSNTGATTNDGIGLINDLYVRDTMTDNGTEPSLVRHQWDSPDIWIEDCFGNKIIRPYGNGTYKVCVKVHNRSAFPSRGTERLLLNWAKAGVDLVWSDSWSGNSYFACGQPKGGFIDSVLIPSIPANDSVVVKVEWQIPSLSAYDNCSEFGGDKWHFCLLARVHDGHPIAHENETNTSVYQMTLDHNNVAWKNLYTNQGGDVITVVAVGNGKPIILNRIISLSPKVISNIGSVTDYAEVYITLDAGLLMAINSANISGLTWVSSNTLRWNGGNASIPVMLPGNSSYTLKTTIHFLADQIPDENIFDFDIVLRSANGDSILGGEHYKCVRTVGRYFQAVANDGNDNLFPGIGEQAELTAEDILESADYRWFDDQGNEVGNGLSCNVNPQQTTTYTLRVTADADGYRSYDQVTVNVAMMRISSISPNPTEGQVRIGYALSRNVSAATLQILNGSGQVVYSQALSGGNGSKITGEAIVNTSSLAAGSYTVRLVSSNGKVHDSKTLVVR